MNIALCDDDAIWLAKSAASIEKHMKKWVPLSQVLTFTEPSALLSAIEASPGRIHAVFIDIEMPSCDGITLAQQLNQLAPKCQIIYVSNHLHYAMDVYSTTHTYFVTKNEFDKRLDSIVTRIVRHTKEDSRKISFMDSSHCQKVVSENELLYFERNLRITLVHTQNEVFQINDSLKLLLQQLNPTNFVRCHNSFLVYLPAISEIHRNHLILENGAKIAVSRNYFNEFKSRYAQWILLQ